MFEQFADLVRRARSCRRFVQDDPIGEDNLVKLVDMVRLVSCGGNQQPLRYRVVAADDECARIFPHIAWAGALKDWDGPVEGERPSGYIAICYAGDREAGPDVDLGIAAETLHLGAWAMGYAACQLGAIRRESIRKDLGLDEKWKIGLLIALGRPLETIVIDDLQPGRPTAYYRGEDGSHHVPKRRLEDVLIR